MTPTRNNQSASSPLQRFEEIYATTHDRLNFFVKRYVWSDAAAKDVLQECYIRLWEKMAELKDDEKLLPLLRTIALRITIDQVRKNARDLYRAEVFHAAQPVVTAADEGLNFREVMQRYQDAVSGLPLQQRKVFQMHKEEGLSYQDIARELEISPHTVKRHMSEALQTLRTQLSPEVMTLAGLIATSLAKML